MRRILVLAVLFALLVGVYGCGGRADKGDGKEGGQPPGSTKKATDGGATTAVAGKLDLSYISENFAMAIVLHPHKALNTPLAKDFPQDELFVDMIEQTGVDPRDIDEVVLLVELAQRDRPMWGETTPPGPPPVDEPTVEGLEGPDGPEGKAGTNSGTTVMGDIPAQDEPSFHGDPGFDARPVPPEPVFGAVFRFVTPIDQAPILKSMFHGERAEAMHEGKPYYKHPRFPVPCAFFPDDKTMVTAEEEILLAMMTATDVSSPLIEQLKKTDIGHDAVAVVVTAPVADMITTILAEERPPEIVDEAVGTVLDTVEAATLTADLQGDTLLTVAISAKDAPAAAKLDEFVRNWFEKGKQTYPGARDELAADMPAGLGDTLAKLADETINAVNIDKKGNDVVIRVKMPERLADLPQALKPMIRESRDNAKRARRMNNLHQIGIAMLHHTSMTGQFPAAAITDKEGKPLLSWRVKILPFVDEQDLYDRFKLDEPWDSEHNIKLVDEMPEIYQIEGHEREGETNLMVFVGEGAPLSDMKTAPGLVQDGSKIMVVQVGADKAVPWSKPADLPFLPENPLQALGELPEDGFAAIFFDGHVQMIPKDIDPADLKAMISLAGSESSEAEDVP